MNKTQNSTVLAFSNLKEKSTSEYITKESMEKVKEIVGKEGTNAWYEKTVEQLLPDEVLTLGKPKSEYVKETDIMDVWFDSRKYTSICN